MNAGESLMSNSEDFELLGITLSTTITSSHLRGSPYLTSTQILLLRLVCYFLNYLIKDYVLLLHFGRENHTTKMRVRSLSLARVPLNSYSNIMLRIVP